MAATLAARPDLQADRQAERASLRIANELELSFSWGRHRGAHRVVRARLVDVWLAEHQAEHGAFDEDKLRVLAAEAGVPYLPPGRTEVPAA